MAFLLLGLSVVLSTGRNLFSKKLSHIHFGTSPFFLCQGVLFLCGGIALLLLGRISFGGIASITFVYAIVYGLLLILAQWFYTASLAKGNTTLCSTVYSLGFILPTLSGAILWAEPFSFLDMLGILCAISAVIVSGLAREINVDVAFFTTAALSDDGVISDFDVKQTMIRKIILKNAKKSIFLFESAKKGLKMTYTLCRKEDATAVIVADENEG